MTHYKLICTLCKNHFDRPSHYKKREKPFCSHTCSDSYRITLRELECLWCNKKTTRRPSEIRGNIFCDKSCAASYNNTKRRKSRRSKCEKLLFNLILEEFPYLDILPNDKTLLDGYEADIAIPSLKLAIEWNGIVHYKPIYGEEKLTKIKQIDGEKLVVANSKNINLIVIPDLVSKECYVKEAFLEIKKIISNLIVRLATPTKNSVQV
jgi:hypothetical protein